MKYENNFKEVTTFESFYKNILFTNGNLIFPYVNVGVSSHELNPTNVLKHIDRCYVVCIEAKLHKINEDEICPISEEEKNQKKVIYLGGFDIEKGYHTEMVIYCKNAYLEILPDSILKEDFWVPIQTPNFHINMDENMVVNFFNHKYLPLSIKKLLSPP